MTVDNSSRRDLFRMAAAGAAAATVVAVSTSTADAYQGNMERALSALYDALASLRESTPNKGGHRDTAMRLVQEAIGETQAGIVYAEEHGGGAQ